MSVLTKRWSLHPGPAIREEGKGVCNQTDAWDPRNKAVDDLKWLGWCRLCSLIFKWQKLGDPFPDPLVDGGSRMGLGVTNCPTLYMGNRGLSEQRQSLVALVMGHGSTKDLGLCHFPHGTCQLRRYS